MPNEANTTEELYMRYHYDREALFVLQLLWIRFRQSTVKFGIFGNLVASKYQALMVHNRDTETESQGKKGEKKTARKNNQGVEKEMRERDEQPQRSLCCCHHKKTL